MAEPPREPPTTSDRLLYWLAAVACGAALLIMVGDVTLDRVLASPAGSGWDKPSLVRAAADAVRLGWLYDLIGPEQEPSP